MASDNTPTPDPVLQKISVGRIGRRLLLAFLLALGLTTGLMFKYLPGQSISIPDWLQTRLEVRFAESFPHIDLQFKTVALMVDDYWQIKIFLEDVELLDVKEANRLRFPDVELLLSVEELLRGVLSLQEIQVSGAFANLHRAGDGSFNVALNESNEKKTMADLLSWIDAALLHPSLVGFERLILTDLSMRYEDEPAKRSWNIDNGRVDFQRVADVLQFAASFSVLGSKSYATTLTLSATREIGSDEINLGATFEDMAASDLAIHSPAMAWLGVLQAPISGSVRTGLGVDGDLQPLSAVLEIGAGVLQPNQKTSAVPFAGASSYFSYDPSSRRLTFDSISVQSDLFTAEANGYATLLGGDKGIPDGLLGQFEFSNVAARPFRNLSKLVHSERVEADFKLLFDPLQIKLGRFAVKLPETTILANGSATAEEMGWNWAINLSTLRAKPKQILRYWPADLKPKLRQWIETNIQAGDLRNINFAVRGAPKGVSQSHLGFMFENAQVKFLKTMPPLEAGLGYLSLTNERLVVGVEDGWVRAVAGGKVDPSGTTFIVPDTRIKKAPAIINLLASGSLEAALSLLDEPPFRFISKSKLRTDAMRGRVEIGAQLALILKKSLQPNEVTFDASGLISDFQSEALIRQHTLAAESLELVADNKGLRVSGSGALDEVPFEGRWQVPFGKDQQNNGLVSASIEVSPALLENFAITLPSGMVSGVGRGQVEITLPRSAPPELKFESDLTGIEFNVPQVNWRKTASGVGALAFSMILSQPIEVGQMTLKAPDLRAVGQLTLTPDAKFERLNISNLEIAQWLKAPVSIIGRGANQPPKIVVNGGIMDLRRLPQSGPRHGRTGPMEVSFDRLQVSRGIALDDFKGIFVAGKGLKGTFNGSLNGTASVTGTLIPRDGRSAIFLNSDDAGAALKAAKLFRKVSGGKLQLSLEPHSVAGTYDGVLKITDTRLKNAPFMAEILNVISVVGLLEQLGKSGILFTEVDVEFRLTPEQLIVTRSSAIGPSMGLSLDGYYDLARRVMDLQGVLSPIYILNGIASIIGRKGEGFIGVNFNLKGNADQPLVIVNPLSALTPGLLRELFRRPGPRLSQ